MSIPFNRPHVSPRELEHLSAAVESRRLSGDGPYTRRSQAFLETQYGFPKTLLTTSCTDALELSALMAGIEPGDEVIVPAFTFVSSANAFALRGAKLVFADSGSVNPNVDPEQIAALITPRTKAIVVVHYAGVCCDMERIMAIASSAGVMVIEDAAQALDSTYRDRPAGTFGRFAAFSFHETKNISCGEGGMIVLNDRADVRRAEIIREKGTNRAAFLRGEIDRYGWVELGSSFLPSELNGAFLWAQLEQIEAIQARRRHIFAMYDNLLHGPLARHGIDVTDVPIDCVGNAHAFYLVFRTLEARTEAVGALKNGGIQAATHYSSLHKSQYFRELHDGRPLKNSDRFSDCLLRLPLYFGLTDNEIHYICDSILAKVRCGNTGERVAA